jgi:hypothetical protein
MLMLLLTPLTLLLLTPSAAAGGVAPFQVLWNSPFPTSCLPGWADKGLLDLAPRFSDFGIETNNGGYTLEGAKTAAAGAFNGATVSTVYTALTAALPRYAPPNASCLDCPNHGCCAAVNGGIPQRGNLSRHLASVGAAVQALFPQPSFSGLVVLDWEEWYPWYSTAGHADDPTHAAGRGLPPALSPRYIVESRDLARQTLPADATTDEVEARAQEQWNASALEFMVETVRLCRQVRPRARWGWYNHPACWAGPARPNTTASSGCTLAEQRRNDALAPLWAVQNAFLPSVYTGAVSPTSSLVE